MTRAGNEENQGAHFLCVTPLLEGFVILLRHSFVVDAEHNASAEQRRVFVGETGVVIVHLIP